jgi:hypothetical protein
VAGDVRALTTDDVPWMVDVMAQRRALHALLSPIFWKASPHAREVHAPHLAGAVVSERHCGLRTDAGFVLAEVQDAATPPWFSDVPLGFVDDFAVTDDAFWSDDGAALLRVAWDELHGRGVESLRVVTARRDAPKVALLESLGLAVGESWWVIAASGERAPEANYGPIDHAGVTALVIPAPPVYDPGGPVLLTLALDGVVVVPELPAIAANLGAVLVIVSTKPSTPELAEAVGAAGFDEVTRYYVGTPRSR